MVTYSPLPRLGDKVSIENVEGTKASDLNEKTGIVKNFFLDKGSSYEIQIRRSNKTKSSKSTSKSKKSKGPGGPVKELIKASNLRVEVDNENHEDDLNSDVVHVLIPCHVDCERDALFFLRCIQSVGEQQCAPTEDGIESEAFHVFVGLSGPQKHRESTLNILMAVSSQAKNSRWHVINVEEEQEEKNRSAQFEHLRHLVDLSASINPNAQIMIIQKDAMMHPLRMIVFKEGKKNLGIPEECPFSLSCKLLLGDTVTNEEGQIGRLITTSKDFDFWKVDPAFKEEGKITWVSTTSCEVMDAEEYFDYMVPTAIMQKFFHLNPSKVTSHRFCELRWLELLKVIAPMDVVDMPAYPWLLAQYKALSRSMRMKKLELSLTLTEEMKEEDSVSLPEITKQDEDFAKRYPPITPFQVTCCRSYFESIIVSYYGWNNDTLTSLKSDKINHVNSSVNATGGEFGHELWSQVESDIASYFNDEPDKLEKSREAWVPLINKKRGYCQIM